MTKHQIVDIVIANAGGGLPSDELSVRRAEVIHLVAPAINYAVVGNYRIERRLNQMDPNATDKTADLSAFVGTYELPVQKDADRDLYYAHMEQGLMDLPGHRAVETIFPKGSSSVGFHMIRSHVELIGVDDAVMGGQTFAWVEKVGGEDRFYFMNLSHTVKTVIARVATDLNNIDYDEDLPVPDHVVMEALNILSAWFTGQRQIPEELINNKRDDLR